MNKAYIIGHQSIEFTNECDQADECGRSSTSSEWSIERVTNKYQDKNRRIGEIDTNYSGEVFVLYVIWSSGDSFGYDHAKYLTPIWVFKDAQKAEEAAALIGDHAEWYKRKHSNRVKMSKEESKKYKDEYSVDIELDDGELFKVCASWNGYFDSIYEVGIVSGTI